MEVITIQADAYKEFLKLIASINDRLSVKEKQPKEIWLDNLEFTQLLKISKRTAQHYRDDGIVSFSQIDAKVYEINFVQKWEL